MGTHSYKLENDAFVNVPNYYPPIEFKPEFKPDGQLLQRISELTVAVQSMQATLGRAFTQGAGGRVADAIGDPGPCGRGAYRIASKPRLAHQLVLAAK